MYLSALVSRLSHVTLLCFLAAVMAYGFPTKTVQADDAVEWRKQVARAVAKNHIYPRSAISRELEGRVRMQITIDRTGKIISYSIVEESEHSVLNKAANRMMKKIDPLPTPPEALADSDLSFIIPITWQVR